MTDDLAFSENRLLLKGRKMLNVSGVEDVDSFDERIIVAMTDTGELTIKGEGMKIQCLNTETGEMSVEGEDIASLVYTGTKTENGFFKRLFR